MNELENEFLGLDINKDLEEHPLAEKIFNLARDRGIELNNYESLKKIIDQIDSEKLSDPKSIIVLAEIIERLINLNNIYVAYDKSQSATSSDDSLRI